MTNPLDDQVRRWLDLTEQIEQLTITRDLLKEELRAAGIGHHATTYGVSVTVSPNRRFNAAKAFEALTPEQQAVCLSPDAAKVKKQLPPAVVDVFMEDAGQPRVVVK